MQQKKLIKDWPKAALHNAMLEALIHNRVVSNQKKKFFF